MNKELKKIKNSETHKDIDEMINDTENNIKEAKFYLKIAKIVWWLWVLNFIAFIIYLITLI